MTWYSVAFVISLPYSHFLLGPPHLDTKNTAAANRQENLKPIARHTPAGVSFSALRLFIARFDLSIAKFKQALIFGIFSASKLTYVEEKSFQQQNKPTALCSVWQIELRKKEVCCFDIIFSI